MTKEEFLKRVKEDKEWAPGWETIEHEFERLYPCLLYTSEMPWTCTAAG